MSEENELLKEILIEIDYIHDYALIIVLLNAVIIITLLLIIMFRVKP
jgi:hypothetical protein